MHTSSVVLACSGIVHLWNLSFLSALPYFSKDANSMLKALRINRIPFSIFQMFQVLAQAQAVRQCLWHSHWPSMDVDMVTPDGPSSGEASSSSSSSSLGSIYSSILNYGSPPKDSGHDGVGMFGQAYVSSS